MGPAVAGAVAIVVLGLTACGESTGPSGETRLDFDFRSDASGWEADFTDFPQGREEDVDFKRRVSGLEPEARYRASFRVEIASDVGRECAVGVGNNVVKAGASREAPVRVVDDDGNVRLSVDKGSQSNSGENALVLGDIRNGLPGCGEEVPWATRELTSGGSITVSADESGGLWLLMGSESVFEVAHELFFTELTVTLRRAEG